MIRCMWYIVIPVPVLQDMVQGTRYNDCQQVSRGTVQAIAGRGAIWLCCRHPRGTVQGELHDAALVFTWALVSEDRCNSVCRACLRLPAKYLEVAYMALANRKTRFKLSPKYHAFNHIADYVRVDLIKFPLAQWLRNPVTWSTQQCEDFTGRVSQLSTAVSSRACHRQVMCRYAVNLKNHW